MLRLLVVDDDVDVVTTLETVLRRAFEVVSAHNGLDALEKLERVEPDLIVMDVAMPCLNGFDTALSIRKNASFREIPLCFLTAADDARSLETGRRLQAALYVTKPFDAERLLAQLLEYADTERIVPRDKAYAVDEILAAEREGVDLTPLPQGGAEAGAQPGETHGTQAVLYATPTQPRILVVDDEPDVVQLIESFLERDYEVVTAIRAADAMEKIIQAEPDLILLDIEMPNLTGYQLSQMLKLNPVLSRIAVMFVTSRSEPRQIDYGFRLGAAAYLTKPFTPEELQRQVREIVTRPGFGIRRKKRPIGDLRPLRTRT